ncbi:MAG: ring-cleaving dioxygenase [Anaerolineae bacterium]
MQLHGLHHLTAVTGNPSQNVDFYTRVLGMRLVKKTVNQDDTSAYHLFYGDETGSAGTELTFFDWPHAGPTFYGNHMITAMGLRVPGEAALAWWVNRLTDFGVAHTGIETWGDFRVIRFADPEGQRLELYDDGGKAGGTPWRNSPVPPEMAIGGLHSVTLTVPSLEITALTLTGVLHFRQVTELPSPNMEEHPVAVFETGDGGAGTYVFVEVRPDLRPGRMGIGGVHHAAFRTPNDAEQQQWQARLAQIGFQPTRPVDRFYFKSVYFREPNGVLFEIATDGPGFAVDEDAAHLGESLALPPFLEPRRAQIEARLKPIAPVGEV